MLTAQNSPYNALTCTDPGSHTVESCLWLSFKADVHLSVCVCVCVQNERKNTDTQKAKENIGLS